MSDALSTVRAEVSAVLDKVDADAPARLAERLLGAPRVFVGGEGRSGFIAKSFAMRLMHLGLSVYAVGETITPGFADGDLLVGVSGSGTTAGTVRAAEQVRAKGGLVVAVTTDPDSPLGGLAEACLVVPAATKWRRPGESATEQPLGSLFDQCTHLVLDAVCLQISRRREVSLAEARAQHASE